MTSTVRKIISISTGGALYGDPDYLPCDEDHPIRPLSPYGISKHTVEHCLFLFAHNYGLDFTVLRYPNVYGPRQDPHGEAGVVAIFGDRLLRGESPVIYGDGTQERDFVYVSDLVRANLMVLERGSGEVYNLGSGRGTSVNEIFSRMKALLASPLDAVHEAPRLGEVYRIFLDPTRANLDLQWFPEVSLNDGLRWTIESLQGRPVSAAAMPPALAPVR